MPSENLTLSLEQIEAILEAAKKATPTPWHGDKYGLYLWGPKGEMVADQNGAADPFQPAALRIRGAGAGLPQNANRRFIELLTTHYEALCAMARRSLSDTSTAREGKDEGWEIAQRIYKETGGATPELRRLYAFYIANKEAIAQGEATYEAPAALATGDHNT